MGNDGVSAQLFVPAGGVAVRGLKSEYGTVDYLAFTGGGALSVSPDGVSIDADAYNVDLQGTHLKGAGASADALKATGQAHVTYRDGKLQLSAARGHIDASGVDLD